MITLTVGSAGPKKQPKIVGNVDDVNETEGGGAQINSERDSRELEDEKRIIQVAVPGQLDRENNNPSIIATEKNNKVSQHNKSNHLSSED